MNAPNQVWTLHRIDNIVVGRIPLLILQLWVWHGFNKGV